MKKLFNEKKIEKELEKIKLDIEKKGYYLTIKGIVGIIVNLIKEQLK